MSRRAFHTGLYEEHCEELAAMYDARRAHLDDWESTPEEFADLESRMEAHLDGLVLGGALALATTRAQATPDDAASLHVLLTLACRLDRADLVESALDELAAACGDPDTDDEDAAAVRTAAADALCHHLPAHRTALLIAALERGDPHVVPVAAACAGFGRHPCGEAIARASAGACADLVPLLRALGRLPGAGPASLLTHIDDPRHEIAVEAALAALRGGQEAAMPAVQRAWPAAWTAVPLALSAGPAMCPRLCEAAATGRTSEALVALGLLGDPAGVDALLAALDDPQRAHAAALGLYLLTGAGREETMVAPEEAERDDDDDDDAAASWLGSPAAGITVDREAWSRWMRSHRAQFRPGVRHRLGAPASPQRDLEVLATFVGPLRLRRCLADEWVIRHGVRSDLEPDMLVERRVTALARVQALLVDAARLAPGGWYFHGRVVR